MAKEQIITANPVLLTAAGQSYAVPCRVMGLIWVGVATLADTALIDKLSGVANPPIQGILWKGLASIVNNYSVMTFGPYGVHCPAGFVLTQISSGNVLVYIMEN